MPRRAFAWLFASVWLVNGLACKLLDLVPRHRAIVARLFGDEHALILTRLIGIAELVFAVWILSCWRWRWSAAAQIAAVAAMNLVEFLFARDLLLFGSGNALVAGAYIALVAYAGFWQTPHRKRSA